MANPTGKGLKPYPKGVSGNPGGRPRKQASIEETRLRFIELGLADTTDEEAVDLWRRLYALAWAGKAPYFLAYIFGPPPKAVEPETPVGVKTIYEVRYVSGGDRPADQPAPTAPRPGGDQG